MSQRTTTRRKEDSDYRLLARELLGEGMIERVTISIILSADASFHASFRTPGATQLVLVYSEESSSRIEVVIIKLWRWMDSYFVISFFACVGSYKKKSDHPTYKHGIIVSQRYIWMNMIVQSHSTSSKRNMLAF